MYSFVGRYFRWPQYFPKTKIGSYIKEEEDIEDGVEFIITPHDIIKPPFFFLPIGVSWKCPTIQEINTKQTN